MLTIRNGNLDLRKESIAVDSLQRIHSNKISIRKVRCKSCNEPLRKITIRKVVPCECCGTANIVG